jgi:hypothetical protein
LKGFQLKKLTQNYHLALIGPDVQFLFIEAQSLLCNLSNSFPINFFLTQCSIFEIGEATFKHSCNELFSSFSIKEDDNDVLLV